MDLDDGSWGPFRALEAGSGKTWRGRGDLFAICDPLAIQRSDPLAFQRSGLVLGAEAGGAPLPSQLLKCLVLGVGSTSEREENQLLVTVVNIVFLFAYT